MPVITGKNGGETLTGGSGNDTINGGNGDDLICGATAVSLLGLANIDGVLRSVAGADGNFVV
jgi:Ca2+-binding RTX toxin-like protein